ncbi:MAG TPA: papain-like cysteine protease family protein [Pyrinomonadaceae bacterium]|nr:papain-like cysteine protease family protein [Pyrinomonadaceae bacterium]
MLKVMKNLLLGLVILFTFSSISKGGVTQLGPNYFVAGVHTKKFEFYAAPQVHGKQRQSNWCWAATTQMVLNYHGLYVQQEQVVQRIFGRQVDSPASPNQILTALSGWAPDNRGGYSAIIASSYVSVTDMINDLAYEYPLIVGTSNSGGTGHAYVLTAVFYSFDGYGRPIVDKVVLRDPFPTSPSRQEWTGQTFSSRVNFIARVHIKRL